MHELQLHEVAQFGEREGLAVVAVERRFPTRSPCEQVVGLKLYCLDVEQFLSVSISLFFKNDSSFKRPNTFLEAKPFAGL